jgi:hypothetical protein
VSAWKEFRFCKLDNKKALGVALSGELGYSPVFPKELTNTLCWASRFGYNSLEVAGSVEMRENLLRQHILLATHSLEDDFLQADELSRQSDAGDKILILWSHLFSDIFNNRGYCPELEREVFFSGTEAATTAFTTFAHESGLSYWTLLHIANSCYPPKPKWPERIQALGHLLHCSITAHKLDELLSDECGFWQEVIIESQNLTRLQNTMRDTVVRNLLDPKIRLRVSSQKRILRSKALQIRKEHIVEFDTSEVLDKFSEALKKELKSETGILVGGAAFNASLKRKYRYEQRQARNQ